MIAPNPLQSEIDFDGTPVSIPFVRLLRGLLAIVLVVSLAAIAIHAHGRETGDYVSSQSAVFDQIQIYVEAIFEAVVAIGLVVGAYIGTRGMD